MGNEFGLDPLAFLSILSPFLVLGPAVMTLLVFGPLLLYPLARWKVHRAQIDDAQLGIKVVLSYFAFIAFQLALLAMMILVFTLFSKASGKGDLYRMGFALLIPSGLVLAAHWVLLERTNQHTYPTVRKLFLGYNLAVTGLLGFTMLLFAFQIFFKKGSAGDSGRFAIAAVIVYVSAWVACGVQFGRYVLGGASSAGPPANVIPPSAIAKTPPPSGPSLPSLSAGSFPPIDQK